MATALVQLIAENPNLPVVDWSITETGSRLDGFTLNDDVDMLPVLEQFAQVLGGTVSEFEWESERGRMYSATLNVMWRDAYITVKGICLASSRPLPVPEVGEVYWSRQVSGMTATVTRVWKASDGETAIAFDLDEPGYKGGVGNWGSVRTLNAFHASYVRRYAGGVS